MKNFQLDRIDQNLVFRVVFDVHQIKLGSSPLVGLTHHFSGTGRFLVGALGSEEIFQILEKFVSRPYSLWKQFCLDYPDHTTQLSRSYHTTIQTLDQARIRISRL